jgi:hypothetical protein
MQRRLDDHFFAFMADGATPGRRNQNNGAWGLRVTLKFQSQNSKADGGTSP